MEEKLKIMTFSKSLRGYACDEVDTYLRYMTDKYEQRSRECTELRRQMALIAAKMNEYTEGLHKTAEAEDAQKRSVQETCDNMIDEAKRQAARILADAESEAEVIRRRAEDNAQTIAANAAREGARVVNEAARSVAARNNAADRLVEEIDSFREEVYALYSRHIAELDRLAARTNDFYDRKTAVAESASPDAAESAEPTDPADGTPLPEPVAEEPAETDEEVPIRIDWKNRRAKRDIVIDIADEGEEDDEDAESAESAEDGAMEVVPELPKDAADTDDIEAEDDLDALFRSLTGKNMLTPERTAEPAETRSAYNGGAEYEDPEESYADSYANEYAAAEADADDTGTEPETYDEMEPDTDGYDESGEPDAPDAETYDEPDEEYGAYDSDDDNAGIEDEDEDAEDDTDWLLTNLKAQYAAKAVPEPKTEKPRSDCPAANAAPESFDELLDSDTATDPVQDISLTGEFERIYNKEQAAKYMEEVEKQPLHVPEKPKNPKKHTRD